MSRKLDAVIHFDSSISDFLTIRLPSKVNVRCTVTYLKFTLPDDAEYDDSTAYLWISGNVEYTTISVNQTGKKRSGFVMPICDPSATVRSEVRTPFNGMMLEEGSLQFKILDKYYNEVQCSRIVVTAMITEATG